jgi:hypothetical protein
MISLMPVGEGQLLEAFDPKYSLAAFARGDHDAKARSWARLLKAHGGPVLMRWGHEMNNGAYAWNIRANGQTPQQFIDAWKHLRSVFAAEGATNVQWVFCPILNWDGAHSFKEAYPGDANVEWAGLDVYNAGGVGHPNNIWESFTHAMDGAYRDMVSVSNRPLILAEVASNEWGDDGTRKADWIRSMLGNEAKGYSHLKALVWFNIDSDDARWIVTSTPKALAAMQGALTDPFYLSDYVTPVIPAGSRLDVFVASASVDSTYATIQLVIDDVVVRTFTQVQGDLSTRTFVDLSYTHDGAVTANQVKVRFTNDDNGKRDVMVDRLVIDGATYQTEAASTYMTGYWDGSTCLEGYFQSEWVKCNGEFRFAATASTSDTTPPTVTLTSPTQQYFPAGSNIYVGASATDSVAVQRVEFYRGSTLVCTELAPPYDCYIRAPTTRWTSVKLTAKAFDTSGNMATASKTVWAW